MKQKLSQAKSKGKSGVISLDRRKSFWVFLAAAVIGTLMRTYQLYADMDHTTGYYTKGSLFLNVTSIVLIAAFILIMLIVFLGSSRDRVIESCILLNPMRMKYHKLTKKLSSMVAVGALIMSALTMCEFGVDVYSAVAEKTFGTMGIIIMALMFIAAITLISVAAGVLNGTGISKGHCFFLASIPVWKTCEVLQMAMTDVTVSNYSLKIYDMFTDMAAAIFFLAVIRFFLGFEKKHTRCNLIIWGYITAVLAVVSTIPRYAMFYLLPFDGRTFLIQPNISDLGLIFFPPALIQVFWTAFEYKVMPKLNPFGRRRWVSRSTDVNKGMKSI